MGSDSGFGIERTTGGRLRASSRIAPRYGEESGVGRKDARPESGIPSPVSDPYDPYWFGTSIVSGPWAPSMPTPSVANA